MFWFGIEDLRHLLDFAWERANSLRPPPGVDFSWSSTWSIPLYGFACVAHRRLRALKPRRLPTLTTLSVPELYGIFALGHVAHLEADRLSRKVAEHPGLDFLQNVASWARREYGKHPERFTVPTGFNEKLDYTVYLVGKPVDDFEGWKYKLRCSWAGMHTRTAASGLVARRLSPTAPILISYHDLALATLFIAEELDGHSIFRPSFLRDSWLMVDSAWFAFSALLARWTSTSKGVLRTNALLQRYFVCLLAFRWLGGHYCHYASVFGLEKAPLIAFQVGLSRIDWQIKHGEWVLEDPGMTFAELGLRVPPWFGDA